MKNLIINKMDNFKFQIQTLKSQIDNIKLQLSNIEMKYNNMFGSNPSEQLLNLSIQILNTGVQAFNTGKNGAMLVSDSYYDQLKNISSLINTILDEYQSKNMQQQMMQQQMMQQQIMQQQMMQQQIMQQQMMQQQMMQQQMMKNLNSENQERINVTFVLTSGKRINFTPIKGTKIKDLFDKFLVKVGVPKYRIYFLLNGEKLDFDDSRKIEEKLYDGVRIITVINN